MLSTTFGDWSPLTNVVVEAGAGFAVAVADEVVEVAADAAGQAAAGRTSGVAGPKGQWEVVAASAAVAAVGLAAVVFAAATAAAGFTCCSPSRMQMSWWVGLKK